MLFYAQLRCNTSMGQLVWIGRTNQFNGSSEKSLLANTPRKSAPYVAVCMYTISIAIQLIFSS